MGRRKSLIANPTPEEGQSAAREFTNAVAEVVLWKPTVEQRKAKARLMVSLEENPMVALDSLSCEKASKWAQYSFTKYWKQPGFQDWLLGKNEFKSRAEYLSNLAMDAMEDIFLSDDPKLASAKVAAAKVVVELGRKMPSKSETGGFLDTMVQEMNRAQLEDFIRQNTPKAIDAEVVDE